MLVLDKTSDLEADSEEDVGDDEEEYDDDDEEEYDDENEDIEGAPGKMSGEEFDFDEDEGDALDFSDDGDGDDIDLDEEFFNKKSSTKKSHEKKVWHVSYILVLLTLNKLQII